MYKLYQGNSGRSRSIDDSRSGQTQPSPGRRPQMQAGQRKNRPPEPDSLSGMAGSLEQLIRCSLSGLETEDIILLLILYLMYRDSGDKELLIIMGAMFFL